jgi:hypothetical protein
VYPLLYAPERVEGAFSEVEFPIYGVFGGWPRSGQWKLTLLFSVCRRHASRQSHKDNRQGQHGKAYAGIEAPS